MHMMIETTTNFYIKLIFKAVIKLDIDLNTILDNIKDELSKLNEKMDKLNIKLDDNEALFGSSNSTNNWAKRF